MKAKDWIKRFQVESFSSVMNDYIEETKLLVQQRGSSAGAIAGAVKEQFVKWRAIAKVVQTDICLDVMEYLIPDIWHTFCSGTAG